MKNSENNRDSYTVNSKEGYISSVNSSTTVNSSLISEKLDEVIEDMGLEPQGIAQTIAEQLDDLKSLDYYNILVKENPVGRLWEAVSITKDMYLRGRIRTKKAIYFQAIIRRWGLKTKFKKDG